MKTHIIQLDSHDDAYSVRDKMAWGKSARILLVWPEKNDHILNRRVDLVLLRRRSRELGSQLAIVSREPDVQFHAGDLGIPIFRSTAQAQTSRWLQRRREDVPEEPEPENARGDLRAGQPAHLRGRRRSILSRVLALAAGAAAVAALGGVLLPSASIRIVPETRTQTLAFTASTGPGVITINASGAIPSQALSVVVEGRHTVETTGRTQVAIESASGTVTFTNLTGQEITIPEGTVVLTGGSPGVRFVVTTTGSVEPEVGAVRTLPVTALLPGADGNVPAGAITAIEGVLGLQLAVDNAAATSGGEDAWLSAPTELDRNNAARELMESLRATAAEDLSGRIGPDDLVLTDQPFLLSTETESYLPADQSPSDVVEVTLRVTFQVLVIPAGSLETLARTVLDAGLEPGFEPLDGEISVALLSDPVLDSEGAGEWEVQAARTIVSIPEVEDKLISITGRTPEEAAAILAGAMDLAEPPEIRLSPAWWPRMPLLPVQIRVIP